MIDLDAIEREAQEAIGRTGERVGPHHFKMRASSVEVDGDELLAMVRVCKAAQFMAQAWPTLHGDDARAVIDAVRALDE